MGKKIQDYLAKPNKTIEEHAKDLLEQAKILWSLGYISNEHMFYLLQEACTHHDDGKANLEFASRMQNKNQRFNPEKEVAHNILSVYYLDPKQYKEEDYIKIACAILHHHNYCDEAFVVREKKELIDQLLLPEYKFTLKNKLRNKILGTALLDPETIVLKGLLHRCDYSASGQYQVEYPNDFLLESLEEMMASWKKKDFMCEWNELQKFSIENREKNIIAVAPTGMGKTEAGLLWIGDTKGFFVLPIRTAINAIYDRIRINLLHDTKINERLAILHSESLEYYRSHTNEIDLLEYNDRGKKFSLPLNISTMDQLFDFVFKYKGYEMKLTTLSYSKIVIDEIQMYGPDLLAYLICGLRQIHELGGKIAVVTATLPPFLRDILSHDANIVFEERRFTSDKIRHSVCVKQNSLLVEDILYCYYNNIKLNRSNKILVVCNTIRKAQEIYRQLKNENNLKLNIFHSRFTQADRKRLEHEIKDFGQTYRESEDGKILDKQDGIWISTSLVEVSLDIDFDYLFTELSELNALFQRMGRCNRKGVKNIDEYNCFVYCDGADVKRGKKGYIDETFYECSKEALKNVDARLTEKEKMDLIDQYFTTENVQKSQFMKEYKEIFNTFSDVEIGIFEEKAEQLRTILNQNIIPKPVYEKNLEKIQELEDRLKEVEANLKQGREEKTENKVLKELWNERLDIYDKLKNFVVAIPKYEYIKYVKNTWEKFGEVHINKYEKVPVVDCHYDEQGYYPLNYEDRTIMEETMMF